MIEKDIYNALKDIFLADEVLKDYPNVDVSDAIIDAGFYRILVNPRNLIAQNTNLYKCNADITIATHLEDDSDRMLIDLLFNTIHTILKNEQLLNAVTGVKAIQIENVSDYEIADNFQLLTITLNIFIQL